MMKTFFTFLFLISFFLNSRSQQIDLGNIKKDIHYFSADELKGRATGSPEELTAAHYIANRFAELGLQPKGKDHTFFYPFTFKKSINIHDTTNGTPSSGT